MLQVQQAAEMLESREFRNMAAACWKPCRYKTTLIFSLEKHLLLNRRKKHLGEAMLPIPFVCEACFPSFHILNASYFHSAFWAVQVHVFHFFPYDKKVWNQVLTLKPKIWLRVPYNHIARDIRCLKIKPLPWELPILKVIFLFSV